MLGPVSGLLAHKVGQRGNYFQIGPALIGRAKNTTNQKIKTKTKTSDSSLCHCICTGTSELTLGEYTRGSCSLKRLD